VTSLKRKAPQGGRKPLKRSTKPLKRSAKAETTRKDREFSLAVRARGVCEIRLAKGCRGTPDNCCHLISRRYRNVRWDEENAVAGCYPCHLYGTTHPAEWTVWCMNRLGLAGYRLLLERAYERKGAA